MRRTFIVIMAFSLMLVSAAPAFARGGPPPGVKPGGDTIAEIVSSAADDDEPEFTLLLAALEYTGLTGVFAGGGQYTVFAPTDEAFAKLPKGTIDSLLKPENKSKLQSILLYHVVPNADLQASTVVRKKGAETLNGQRVEFKVQGGNVMVDGAKVISANVGASNGVIHVIDSVILPSEKNIVDVAKGAGTFNTLLAAAKAAGLVDALTGDEALTVFAPTDAAFKKLPAGTVENLLKPENKNQLAAILKYHIIAGRVYAKDAVNGGMAKTLEGSEIVVEIVEGQINVDNAKVVASDIDAANGVVHVIDTVILPMSG